MKFKKPLSLLLAAVLLCAFAVPLLETPALAADKEIHEVATAGVYKWITITAGEGGAVTEVVQTGGVLPPGMSLGKNRDVSCLVGTPTTPGTYILTGETHYEDDAASWKYTWSVRLFVDVAATPTPTPTTAPTTAPTTVPTTGTTTAPTNTPTPTLPIWQCAFRIYENAFTPSRKWAKKLILSLFRLLPVQVPR